MIRTTVNCSKEIQGVIDDLATRYGATRSGIIILLINKIMSDHRQFFKFGQRIQYQKRLPDNNWCSMHVSLEPRDYEFCLDVRKLCKKSVSHLIAIAVKIYLNEIITQLNKPVDVDNNTFKNYIIINEEINNVICWRLYWGYPWMTGEKYGHDYDH